MTPEQQNAFLVTAASRRMGVIHWYSVLALQTTASTNELRSLRLGDVFLMQGVLQIRREGAKNKYRIRTIPLETPEVVWALERLIERARSLGATAPHHCLFPIQAARHIYDPLKPMSREWIEKAMGGGTRGGRRALAQAVRSAPHGHHAHGGGRTPIQVIMAFAGQHDAPHAAALYRPSA